MNSDGYIRWYFVGIAEFRRNTKQVGMLSSEKKVCQKFVTSSDENPREANGYISDGQPTTHFVGIYFIGNLSDTFPTALIIGKSILTKYICRRLPTKDVRRNIPTKNMRGNILTNVFHRKCLTTIWSE